MSPTFEKAKADIAPEWIELSNSLRGHVATCLSARPDDAPTKAMAREALTLCDHVDRLHEDLRELLEVMETGDGNSDATNPDEREIDLAAIEAQRETHEMRADPRDILKALLMWRDDPAERVRERR